MNVKQLATAAAVAMVMSSGSLLAASDYTLAQYIKVITFENTKLGQATSVRDQTAADLKAATDAKNSAYTVLTTVTTASDAAKSALMAHQDKLAADKQAALDFPTSHGAVIAADAAAVKALADQVKADAGNKAKRQADSILLAAAKAQLVADKKVSNASLLAAIAADKALIAKDNAAITKYNSDLAKATSDYAKAAGNVDKLGTKHDYYVAAVDADKALYDKDHTACQAAYGASAC